MVESMDWWKVLIISSDCSRSIEWSMDNIAIFLFMHGLDVLTSGLLPMRFIGRWNGPGK